MFCTNCGNDIEDDSVYCNYCGDKIDKEETDKIDKEETDKIDKEETDKIDKEETDIIKNIPEMSRTLCMVLLIIGFVASVVNVASFYITMKDTAYIFGQIIFVLMFIVLIILLWKSKKIGGVILILFILFKMISSAYYYRNIHDYLINNLIFDEIFYFATILSLIFSWKILK